jgi:transcriptional regulator with XRE-family HTH domain
MRIDKEKAIALRRTGLSYSQIQAKLDISKSTLSSWLRDIPLSQEATEKIARRVNITSTQALIQRNVQQTALAQVRADHIRHEASKEVRHLITDPLFLTGIALYWAEGYKKGASGSKWKCVDFANSDPAMIQLMMVFFRKFCITHDSEIKIQVIAHHNISAHDAIAFWSKITAIPKEQFIKTQLKVSKASQGKRRNTLTHGTVHIRMYDVRLFFRIIGWIEGLKLLQFDKEGL